MKLNREIETYKVINAIRCTNETQLEKKVRLFKKALPKANMRQFVDVEKEEVCTEPRYRDQKPNQIREATQKTGARKQYRARMN